MRRLTVLCALALIVALPAVAESTWDAPLDPPQPYHVQTEWLENDSDSERVVHHEIVHFPNASYIRIYFGDVALEGDSFLRISSDLDGEVQELDAAALEMWNHSSGYFNGNTVRVELVAGPRTTNNRFEIKEAAHNFVDPITTGGDNGCDPGCCGTDDRVASDEDWVGRLLPAGCTASIYTPTSCAVSAGHCIGGGSMIMAFKVPASNPNCTTNLPPISEQFPVAQFAFTNGGVGNDWAALTMGTNNLGQTPFERYGEFRPIKEEPPTLGSPATVWGYGQDNVCVDTYTQQTSGGFIEQLNATSLRFSIDVTFGNSGSSVMIDGEEIGGIVTHCCCPNQGTRMDHPNFVAARESLCPTAAPQAAPLVSANVIVGTQIAGNLAALQSSDDVHFEVVATQAGPRYSDLTEITAQSPSSTIGLLNVTVEYGPANASPVFYSVQLFNNSTASWQGVAFGTTSTTIDTVVNEVFTSNANAYVNGSGLIRIRVAQTSRVPQTPGGFTKLVDLVSVTVQ